MRFGFFAERQVGIGSAAGAIEPHIRSAGHCWTDVSYVEEGGLIERASFLPPRARGTFRGYLQVQKGLAQGPFDALFFLTHNPAVFHPRTLAKTPTLLWTDVTPSQLDEQAEQYAHTVNKGATVQGLKHRMVLRTFEKAAAVVGWSNWARKSFVQDYGIAEEHTHVVHPGVDLERFRPFTDPKPQGLPQLLFVGGDFERKGGAELLSVFREQFFDRAVLNIVTRDAVPECPGVVIHHGLTPGSPKLVELYRNASAFVLPTKGDCFSIASMEAMAMGLPVIVGNVGGISDIVEQGESGFLVTPGSQRELAEALAQVLSGSEVARRLGLRGRAIVEAKFDARKTAAQLLEILENIALHSRPRT